MGSTREGKGEHPEGEHRGGGAPGRGSIKEGEHQGRVPVNQVREDPPCRERRQLNKALGSTEGSVGKFTCCQA